MIKRILSLFAAVVMTAAFCFPSYAAEYYASDESGKTDIPEYIASIKISEEDVELPQTGENNTYQLTPDGNLTLVDDYSQIESEGSDKVQHKQFLTVTTKSGNTFYIIVDRDGNTDNVHFLNMVDEADLLALLGEEAPEKETETEKPSEEQTEDVGDEQEEKDKPKEKNSKSGSAVVIVLILAGGGFALYWFKFRNKGTKQKPAVEDTEDYGDDEEEETVNEDEDMYDIYNSSEDGDSNA